mgnify:CR=1 FL=1
MEECTEMIEVLKIRENENIAKQAANWFHQKWGIPLEAYQESFCDCLKNENVVPLFMYGSGDGEPNMTKMYIHQL